MVLADGLGHEFTYVGISNAPHQPFIYQKVVQISLKHTTVVPYTRKVKPNEVFH